MCKKYNVDLTSTLTLCMQPMRVLFRLEWKPMSVRTLTREFGRLDTVMVKIGDGADMPYCVSERLLPYRVRLDIYSKAPLTIIQRVKLYIFKKLLIKYIEGLEQC